jgi:hypothetical protein
MTQGADDILSVILLAQWSELHTRRGEVPLDIAPLLETVDDLEQGTEIIGTLLSHDTYRQHLEYARFFAASGPREAIALAKKLSAISLVLNTISAAVVILGASFITGLLGDSYSEAAEVLRWIAFVPLLSAWQLFAGNALSGIGHHKTRLYHTMSSAGLNIALNLILIPSHSWRGAAVATMVTELYLVVLHWRTLWRLASRAEEPADATVATSTA